MDPIDFDEAETQRIELLAAFLYMQGDEQTEEQARAALMAIATIAARIDDIRAIERVELRGAVLERTPTGLRLTPPAADAT